MVPLTRSTQQFITLGMVPPHSVCVEEYCTKDPKKNPSPWYEEVISEKSRNYGTRNISTPILTVTDRINRSYAMYDGSPDVRSSQYERRTFLYRYIPRSRPSPFPLPNCAEVSLKMQYTLAKWCALNISDSVLVPYKIQKTTNRPGE